MAGKGRDRNMTREERQRGDKMVGKRREKRQSSYDRKEKRGETGCVIGHDLEGQTKGRR